MASPQTWRSDAAIEAEICELWGHMNAATYRFLMLLAEFDRQEGWSGAGVASLAQWLNWQCGIGAVAAREKVRVARALQELPQISEAFRLGRLSYSKVRAMTRVATPAIEDTLLNIALHGTAAQMEQLVRKFRWVERIEATRAASAAYRERSVEFHSDDDQMVVLHARLPVEMAAIVRKAIEAAEASLEAVSAETESNVSAETFVLPDPPVSHAAARADGLVRLAEHFLETEDGTSGMTAAPRYEVVVHINQSLLARSHESSVGAGTGRSINRSASSSTSSDATGDTKSASSNASNSASSSDSTGGSNTGAIGATGHRTNSVISDADLTGPVDPLLCELESGDPLAAATARRLACDCSHVGIVENEAGEPLNIGRRSRAIPKPIRRALQARDGGCRFPGCDRRRFTEGHHIEHWANGGETSLENLVTLCHFHHHLVHEGGFSVDNLGLNVFEFRDPCGKRVPPNGRLVIGRSGSRESGRRHDRSIFALNNGLRIDSDTCRSRWTGERLDYVWVVGDLYAGKYPHGFQAACA